MSTFNVHEWNQKRRLAEINESMNPFGKQDPKTLNKFLSILGGTTPKVDPEGPSIGNKTELEIILNYLIEAADAGKIQGVNLNQLDGLINQKMFKATGIGRTLKPGGR